MERRESEREMRPLTQIYRWANEPRPDRLLVAEQLPGAMRFWDRETWEWVEVSIKQDVKETIFRVGQGQVEKPAKHLLPLWEARKVTVGEGEALRQVFHVVTREHATALRVGLTVHSGAFSSTPHSFELHPERGFEEVFWFHIPGFGKALVEGDGLWPNGEPVDAAWPVEHGQLLQVPMGTHRVAGLPDDDWETPYIVYVWGYLALHDRWEKL